MKTFATLIAVCCALVLRGSFASAHTDGSTSTGGHCTGMMVTDYVNSDAAIASASTAWQDVTDAHLNFTTSDTGCVIITFSGPAQLDAGAGSGLYNALHVRTLLDGHNLCVLGGFDDRFLEAESPVPLIAGSITRICRNVAAGAHSIQVQLRNTRSGDSVFIGGSMLTVSHN